MTLVTPPVDALSEAGAALRFAQRHGNDVRFDHRRHRWLLWHGHRWRHDDDEAIWRLALKFVREWQQEAVSLPSSTDRDATLKFTLRLEGLRGMAHVLALAKTMMPIANAGDRWDDDPWLLGVPNGVVDLRTGVLRDGHPSDQITMQTTTPYDAESQAPRWSQFVLEVFGSDPTLVEFVRKALGYSLTGVTTEQVLFLLYGTGSNGKGTLTTTVKKVLGDYAWNMPFATIELKDRAAIPNDLAALVGRRFITASETNDGTRLNEARIKTLTGCDPVTARFLHGEFFAFEPFGKYWLSVNHRPLVHDDSYGFWRRLRLIPFTQRFAVNQTLAAELLAEASGILRWCIGGCLAWQLDGLHPPEIVTAATKAYESDSDPLTAFLAEACVIEEPGQIRASDAYRLYEHWANTQALSKDERLKSTKFGLKMAERFKRAQTATGRIYRGLRARTE